jgi:hypothetical protein
MMTLPPIQLGLSPGESVVLWQSRPVERATKPIPIIEILPENHSDIKLNYFRRGVLIYDRRGSIDSSDPKGKWIDFYC